MSAAEMNKTVDEMLLFLSKYDDIRRSVIKKSSTEAQKRLRGLTLHQHTAVEKVMLLTASHPQGVTLREFATVMQISPSSASVMVDSLVNRGLLERSQNPTDRRTINIRISEKGGKIISESRGLAAKELSKLLSLLSEEDRDKLAAIMAKLSA